MDDIKLSDHRPVFADIMLHSQSNDNETPAKFVIIFSNYLLVFLSLYCQNTHKNKSAKTDLEQPSQKTPLIIIIIIILIVFIGILSLLAIYHFILKHPTKEIDM
jgi:quinol-cytochrome oxidoreductase complex cytochrome b subunit